MTPFGYAGKILRVDLSSGEIAYIPTAEYAGRFLGGRGVAAKIYWDEVAPEVKAYDPENRLIFMTGPLAGLPGVSGSNWCVSGKSPGAVRDEFASCNLSGSWGAHLKYAGYDGIVVQGKSTQQVYLFVSGDTVELRDASHLWGKGTTQTRKALKAEIGNTTRVVGCGPAGENRVQFASLLADGDACGGGGFGGVMGSKRLKAIAVSANKKKIRVARPDDLREHIEYIQEATGAERLPLIANDWLVGAMPVPWGNGLLGRDADPEAYPRPNMKKLVCEGCSGHGCFRAEYQAADGTKGKFMCGPTSVYTELAYMYYGKHDWDDPFYANRVCNEYGVNIYGVAMAINWLLRCSMEGGILTQEEIGIPLATLGSREFIEALVKKISLREGIGDILAQGVIRASDIVGKGSEKFITDPSGELISEYSVRAGDLTAGEPRLWTALALLFAAEPRVPRHQWTQINRLGNGWLSWINHKPDAYVSSEVWRAAAKRFMGSELAADFSTCAGDALAAKIVQDRSCIVESLIACIYVWPIMILKNSADHVGDSALESKIFSAVTGRDVGEEEMLRLGERIFNLERAIRVKEGHQGRSADVLPEFYFTQPLPGNPVNPECLVPGRNGDVISRKGEVLDRDEFEGMKDEYYHLRGWDVATGLQTGACLQELGLTDVAQELEEMGLLAEEIPA